SASARTSPKRSVDSPVNSPAGAPRRPSAIAVLKTAPPAWGAKAASPSPVQRGSMSINASPQHRIIPEPPAIRPHSVATSTTRLADKGQLPRDGLTQVMVATRPVSASSTAADGDEKWRSHMVEKSLMGGLWPSLYEPFRSFGARISDWLAPASEASSDDKTYRIAIELPGVDEKDVELTVDDGVVTVKGE